MKKCFVLLLLLFFSAVSYASDECVSELSSSSNYGDLNKIFVCLNEKVKALENEVKKLKSVTTLVDERGSNMKTEKSVSANINPIVVTPKLAGSQTAEKNGLTFKLLHCTQKGKRNTVCELSVVSNKDRVLELHAPSTIGIAASGIQYNAASASLGASGQGEGWIKYRMVSGLPLILLSRFSSIPNDEKGFALLEISTYGTTVQFRDVNFTDQK